MSDLTPEEGVSLNRTNWDARVPVHLQAYSYNRALQNLRDGGQNLSAEVIEAVGDVKGCSLVHLMCHLGLDTLSWARLGAEAAGVDFSGPALDAARGFADELNLEVGFIQSDVYAAAETLDRQYDVVFTSEGVLCWLPDLDGWAKVIARLLKPGGRFYLQDGHPFAEVFENADTPEGIAITYGYFDRSPLRFGPGPSYAGPDTTLPESVEWMHSVSEILNSLIGAGLTIQCVDEMPNAFFEKFEAMEPTGEGIHDLPGKLRGKLPMRLAVLATKPA